VLPLVTLTGGSDVARVKICVASSPPVITSVPKSGFVLQGSNGCTAFMSCCDLTSDITMKAAGPAATVTLFCLACETN